MGGSSVKRTHRPKGGTAIGPHLMKVLNNATCNKNIEIRTSNKVVGLLTSGDAVTGVKVQNADGSNYSLKAKAVIIATGGFGANLAMVARLHGANRLGGNGVADIVVNGRLAGQAAVQRLHH